MGELPSLESALRFSADYGHEGILSILLQAKADPNAAADSGIHGVGFTQVGAFPLNLAAKRGHISILDTLVCAGANIDAVDQNGRTSLIIACASGKVASAKWFLEHGASVEACTHYGHTALHCGALLPHPEIVELLLSFGAAVNAVDNGMATPLHLLFSQLICQELPGRSNDPSGFGDEYCYCPQMGASLSYSPSEEDTLRVKRTASALLQHGADTTLRDQYGRRATDVLESKRRPDLSNLFEYSSTSSKDLSSTERRVVRKRTASDCQSCFSACLR